MNSSDLKKNEYGLEPIQNAVLDIYKEFSKVCAAHGLRYYAAYGTCLGAVRHHGFIPWDDDFDVMMPRQDYEQFRELCPGCLPENLAYIDWHNTKEMVSFTCAKIQLTDRVKVYSVERQVGWSLPHGIYIDIFPLDGAPRGRFARTIWLAKYRFLCLAFNILRKDSSVGGTMRHRIGRILGKLINKTIYRAHEESDLSCYFDSLVQNYPCSEKYQLGCLIGPYGVLKGSCNHSVYGDGKPIPFEDVAIPVPQDFSAYLECVYGDWQRLPPEEKRVGSHKALRDAPWKFGPTGI